MQLANDINSELNKDLSVLKRGGDFNNEGDVTPVSIMVKNTSFRESQHNFREQKND